MRGNEELPAPAGAGALFGAGLRSRPEARPKVSRFPEAAHGTIIADDVGVYFVTISVADWLPVFVSDGACRILSDSLNFCHSRGHPTSSQPWDGCGPSENDSRKPARARGSTRNGTRRAPRCDPEAHRTRAFCSFAAASIPLLTSLRRGQLPALTRQFSRVTERDLLGLAHQVM